MRVRDFPAPRSEAFAASARAWLAAPTPGPPIRGAATVLLVRDHVDGPQVYVQRRVATMEFAASVYVFPGGGVDPVDTEVGTTPDLSEVADRMGMPAADAAVLVACAVREVEEECGVVVAPAALAVRGNWVTPPFEPRRYDTWFFAAPMPDGQIARGTTTESDHARWVRPADLLAEGEAGTALMLPPTIVMLEELAAFDSVSAYLGDEPQVSAIHPELTAVGDSFVMRVHLP